MPFEGAFWYVCYTRNGQMFYRQRLIQESRIVRWKESHMFIWNNICESLEEANIEIQGVEWLSRSWNIRIRNFSWKYSIDMQKIDVFGTSKNKIRHRSL